MTDVEKAIKEIQYQLKGETLDKIASKIGYSRPHLTKVKNGTLADSSDSILKLLRLHYSSILQNVPHETPYHKNRLLLKNNSFIRFEDLAGDGIFKPIPFYNINVSAGDVIFLDDGTIEDREPDDYMFIPKYVDADIAFPTYGHSMYPEISNGDKVAYKFLKDWSFFNYGMKYMIVTNEQRMVKYIKRHAKKEYLLLESRNPDYQPIDMPINSIRYILQVRYIGKIEM